MVGPGRFELPTLRLSAVRSSQLSYGPGPDRPDFAKAPSGLTRNRHTLAPTDAVSRCFQSPLSSARRAQRSRLSDEPRCQRAAEKQGPRHRLGPWPASMPGLFFSKFPNGYASSQNPKKRTEAQLRSIHKSNRQPDVRDAPNTRMIVTDHPSLSHP